MRDLKWIAGLFTACFLLLILISVFIIPPASAYGITQNITVINTTPRIEQGSVVYIDEMYDISGVTGWSNKIAWYGKYATEPNYDITPVIVTLPGRTHSTTTSQYYYTISNGTFSPYPGRWFQYYNDEDQHGNLEAFYVELYRPYHLNETNMSGVISYEIFDNSTTLVSPKPYILAEVNISDYLIARGDKFNLTVDQLTHAWLFGRIDYLYDYQSFNGTIDVEKEFIETLEPGSYTLLLQTPSIPNFDFTVKYNSETNMIDWFDSKSFAVYHESLEGCSPQVTLEKLKRIFKGSNDNYNIYKFELQDPSISIRRIDQVYKNGTSVLDVRGYTNVAPGTMISLTLDQNKHSYIGEAAGDNPGNLRYYQIYVPITLNELPNGVHTISAMSATGGEAYSDFVVSELPADSYVPNATLKYIVDRNPWIPTPTPEIITKIEVVSVPGPVVTVTVTPAIEVVHTQQEKVMNEKIWFWVPRVIISIIGIVVLIYLLSVYLRGRKQ